MKLLNAVIGLSVGVSTALLVSLSSNKVSAFAASSGVFAGGFHLGRQIKEKSKQPKILAHLKNGRQKTLIVADLARILAEKDGGNLSYMTSEEIFNSDAADVKHYLSVARSIVG